jgi:uncharacterized membrane protein YgdD (TMEM256/DUF423 family)
MMNQKNTLFTGIILAGLGVIIGAFGAHALKNILVQTGRQDTFELAVRYQFYHSFALIISGLLMSQFPSSKIKYAVLSFLTGIVFFSGSLYILSLTGVTMLGAVTPFGGLFFILGWFFLFLGVLKK